MDKRIPDIAKQLSKRFLFPVPSHLQKHQIEIGQSGLDAIRTSIKKNYHTGWREEKNYSKRAYEKDLNAHLFQRLEIDRRVIVPWLDDARALKGMRVLEIGCGTGSSTVALAEQGAKVTGIDIDDGALLVARERAKIYGVEAEFGKLNADGMAGTFAAHAFDAIIFFACLEHMTVPERLTSLRDAWEMLPGGGLLVVIETPNRLWYFDGHTSSLPFFHWLPNDLAFQYSRFSARENFRELYRDYTEASKEQFLRRGRGVSFHEFDIAIGPVRDLKVVSSLATFQGLRHKLTKPRLHRQFKSVLKRAYPGIHDGFFDDYLYMVIEKAGPTRTLGGNG